jgi:hypothetical protein
LKYKICVQFWIAFALGTTIIILGYMKRSELETPCGADPIWWVMIFFVIYVVRAFCELIIYFQIACCKAKSSTIGCWYLSSSIILGIAALAWIIYGLVLYFAPENDC